jgi:hypothetical protein
MTPQRLPKAIVTRCDQSIERGWETKYVEDRQVGANRDPWTTRFDFFHGAFRKPGFFCRLPLGPVSSQAGFLETQSEGHKAAQGRVADDCIGL